MSTLEISLPSRLTNRNFLLLWQGQVVSQLGNQAFSLATAFWIMEATGSASLMGLLLATTALPAVLLSPLGGAVADRLSRIRILIACDLVSGLAIAAMALAMLSGRLPALVLVGMLFGVALLSGVMNAFFQPAFSAIVPDLVPADRLLSANSLYMFSFQALQLVGQGVGIRARVGGAWQPDSGVSLAGFRITVLPMASAGATFHVAIAKGKFHGTIRPQTPRGSRNVKLAPGAETGRVEPPNFVAAPA